MGSPVPARSASALPADDQGQLREATLNPAHPLEVQNPLPGDHGGLDDDDIHKFETQSSDTPIEINSSASLLHPFGAISRNSLCTTAVGQVGSGKTGSRIGKNTHIPPHVLKFTMDAFHCRMEHGIDLAPPVLHADPTGAYFEFVREFPQRSSKRLSNQFGFNTAVETNIPISGPRPGILSLPEGIISCGNSQQHHLYHFLGLHAKSSTPQAQIPQRTSVQASETSINTSFESPAISGLSDTGSSSVPANIVEMASNINGSLACPFPESRIQIHRPVARTPIDSINGGGICSCKRCKIILMNNS